MDNDLQELEAELQRLRPLAPSRTLTDDIARRLASAPDRSRNFWAWTALPVAAMVAGLVLLRDQPAGPASTPAVAAAPVSAPAPTGASALYKPVSAENVLYAQSDDGLVTLADGTTARRTRSSYVDIITWRNPRTRASLKWSVPRIEERVTPVSFQ